MRLFDRNLFRRAALLWIAATAGIGRSAAVHANDEHDLYREIALTPYRVAIGLLWEADAGFTADFRDGQTRQLRGELDRVVGGHWTVSLDSRVVADASRLPEIREGHRDRIGGDSSDKVFLIAVRGAGGTTRASVCEWDAETGLWSPIVERESLRQDFLPAVLLASLRAAYRPLFRIVSVDERVRLIARAGEIPTPDPDFGAFDSESVLQPAIVYFDRQKIRQRTQFPPMTYVVTESRERGFVFGRLVSAFRAPLGGSRRQRVELWALGGEATLEATTLKLVRQDDATRPLMGLRVVASPRVDIAEEPRAEPIEMLSRRDGGVRLVPHPSSPIVWLYVWSGQSLLARVPYAPGRELEASLPLPDDTIRLRVEGELDRLKGDVIENVARRAVVRAQAITAAKSGDAATTRNLLAALRDLPGEKEFLQKLLLVRTGGVRDARSTGSRGAELRINQACDSLGEIISNYLAADRTRQTIEEVEALLQLKEP